MYTNLSLKEMPLSEVLSRQVEWHRLHNATLDEYLGPRPPLIGPLERQRLWKTIVCDPLWLPSFQPPSLRARLNKQKQEEARIGRHNWSLIVRVQRRKRRIAEFRRNHAERMACIQRNMQSKACETANASRLNYAEVWGDMVNMVEEMLGLDT